MSYYGLSDIGNIRKNNEDSFHVWEPSDELTAAVVADGMGGHTGGKEASSFAVDFVTKSINDAAKYFEKYTVRQIEGFLKNTVIKLNKEVYAKAAEAAELFGMGTTLVICIVCRGKFYAANVGDSRLYLYSSEGLNQITRDHSYVSELLDMGVITKEQALTHPNKNIITRAIGTELNVQPDIYKGRLNDDDVILICSDGLSNMVSDEVISDTIKNKNDAVEITDELVALAKENGGKDNITLVCIKSDKRGELSL